MGAGCNYTLNQDSEIKAYWLDIPQSEEDNAADFCDTFYFFVEDVKETLKLHKDIVETHSENQYELWYKESFKIILETTYHGDGLLIQLECIANDYEPHYELMLSKLGQCYDRIIKHLNKYYSLNIATSGWTSTQVDWLEKHLPAGYSVKLEYNGRPKAQYVLRYCDEYVKGFSDSEQAIKYARKHDKQRQRQLELELA